MRTLIYARYSSDRQNARSIDAQVSDCRTRAEREGWTVVDVFMDYETSGGAGITESQRPGIAAMLARVEVGGIDQVLADSTSRIARDQADAIIIRRRLEFAGARLFTLSVGEVDDIRGLITGFVDAQARKDIAHHIRRGQREIVREGRAPAGIAYGYAHDNRIDDRGQVIRGLRKIEEDQAAIVRRIFAETQGGASAKAIAERLNKEGIPGPRGDGWRASVIHGDAKRGNGILRNRLYNGELVVGRTSKVQHPITRRAIIRPNPPESWTIQPAEQLRIVDADVFAAVQAVLAEGAQKRPEQYRRSRYLLSGLGTCAVCGGGWIKLRATQWGCGRNHDGAGCSNTRTIIQEQYEARALAQLKAQLLDPDLVSAYVRERHRQFALRAAEGATSRADLDRRLTRVKRKIDRFVAAIAEGAFAEIRDALAQARAERDEIEQALATIEALPVVALHPALAEDYRRQIEGLELALSTPEAQEDAVPRLRALIGRIIVTPNPAGRGVNLIVQGKIDQMLDLANGAPVELGKLRNAG